jgi:adenylosuccinate lyase
MEINQYTSPFSNRYGTNEMRSVWSEKNRRILWHKAWLEAASLQFDIPKQGAQGAGFYDEKQYAAALEEEKHTKHDLVAERNTFSKSLPKSIADYIHVGLTSSDIEDYADEQMIKESISLLNIQVRTLINSLAKISDRFGEYVILGRTHLQEAEPTLLGYRFLWYLSEIDNSEISRLWVHSKGMHGAVGTNANLDLIGSPTFEELFILRSPVFQTYPRQQDLRVCGVLSQLASVLHKMAFDIRIMAMEGMLEEVKSKEQYGSSAMPGKNNPIKAEKICGLARLFPGYYQSLWQCAANSLLERTLDDSSLRRVVLPEMFLCMSELLDTSDKLINSLHVVYSELASRNGVLHEWKAWLPSRVLAIVRSNGKSYQSVYPVIEDTAITCATAEEYLECLWSDKRIADTKNPTSTKAEVYLGLDALVDFVKKESKRWIEKSQ